ncbi:hypothetical protein [Oscillatoria salina]|uniref:hypothetical protein n=1 Tax=Oscillatoria salina TaxID=331517 RepID=UPI001CCECA51|nr:hypothetical protein [Oscillatoria salina]MBZ8180188.1 hypothetical protein [Oscillatoria salina IIICB1]
MTKSLLQPSTLYEQAQKEISKSQQAIAALRKSAAREPPLAQSGQIVKDSTSNLRMSI